MKSKVLTLALACFLMLFGLSQPAYASEEVNLKKMESDIEVLSMRQQKSLYEDLVNEEVIEKKTLTQEQKEMKNLLRENIEAYKAYNPLLPLQRIVATLFFAALFYVIVSCFSRKEEVENV